MKPQTDRQLESHARYFREVLARSSVIFNSFGWAIEFIYRKESRVPNYEKKSVLVSAPTAADALEIVKIKEQERLEFRVLDIEYIGTRSAIEKYVYLE